MNNVSKFSFCILFLVVLVIFCGAVSAAEWNVSVGDSIQSAVNSASENDTIIVNDDNGTSYTYNENVVINKKVSLQAASDLVTVRALNSSKPVITVNSLGSGTLIQGFTITGATNSNGILLSGTSKCNIQNNTVTNNRNGIFLYNGASNNIIQNNLLTDNSYTGILINDNFNTNIIQNSTIQNNILTRNYYGIYLATGSSNSIVQNNTITNSTCEGIFVCGSVNNIIQNNTATNNRYGILLSNNSKNNIIQNNTATNNQYGIFLYNGSSNNLVQNNLLTDNSYYGVLINYNSNTNIIQNSTIQNNILTRNYYGIYLSTGSSNSIVRSNIATGNQYGVYISNSSANVNFNRISGNSRYGLYNTGNGTVNATNNWWGSNNPIVSLSSPSDICIQNGIVTYNPWLVLNVNATSNMISGSESIITADLTHNNADEDTSSSGHIPDGLPVNFVTSLGTITTPTYTRNGKSSAVLKLNETIQSATISTTATFDNQSGSTQVTKQAAQAVLNITADDVLVLGGSYPFPTGLTISQQINLTDPVTWVSIVYRHVDEPGICEVDIIVNGETVFTKWFANYYFLHIDDEEWWCDFPDPAIWGMDLNPDLFMYYARILNFAEQNGQDMGPIYQEMSTCLTNIDSYMAYYHRDSFCDNIQTTLTYPGGSLSKTETITYVNDPDAGFEKIQSFAITTGKVTDDIVEYWLNQNSTCPVGHMKAAYGTFMTALTTLWFSDKLADEMVPYLNVTWARSAPTLVTCGVSGGKAYVSCPDPAMGMSIEGNTTNVKSFRFACSFMLSEMENMALSATGLNVTSSAYDLGLAILNGDIADIIDNGTEIIVKLNNGDVIKIIIDPETGLVKDMLGDYKGAESTDSAYCYHDDRTDTLGHQINEFLAGLTDEQLIALGIGCSIGVAVASIGCPEALIMGALIYGSCTLYAAHVTGVLYDPWNIYKEAQFLSVILPPLIPAIGLEKAAGQIVLKYTISREVTEIIVPYMDDGVIFTCRYVEEISQYMISTQVIRNGALTTVKNAVLGSTPKEGIKKLAQQLGWLSFSGVVNIIDPENNSCNTTYYNLIGQYIE